MIRVIVDEYRAGLDLYEAYFYYNSKSLDFIIRFDTINHPLYSKILEKSWKTSFLLRNFSATFVNDVDNQKPFKRAKRILQKKEKGRMIKYRGTCLARVPPVRPGNPGIANEREETSLISPLISREIRRKTRLHCSLLTWTTIVLGTCPRTVSYMRNIICCRVNKENGRPLWRQFLLCRREEYDIVGPTSWIYRDSSLVIIENDNYNWQSRFEDQDIYIYITYDEYTSRIYRCVRNRILFCVRVKKQKGENWMLWNWIGWFLTLDGWLNGSLLRSYCVLIRYRSRAKLINRDVTSEISIRGRRTRKLVQNVRVNAMWRDTG